MTLQPAPDSFATTLDECALGSPGRIAGIDWAALDAGEAKRLRQFGFDDGVAIEALHAGLFGRDPMAVKVGRMTVAIRRRHARAIRVAPLG